MDHTSAKPGVRLLRIARKIHRTTGAFLFVFILAVSLSGVLLGWKKHTAEAVRSQAYNGVSADAKDWLPIDSLERRACRILHDSVSEKTAPKLERIDIRPGKGTAKFVFGNHWGLQLDCTTGTLVQLERRNFDMIANIHNGSALDNLFNTGGDQLKVAYTTITGLALVAFTITGFWLWYGPIRMRQKRRAAGVKS